MAADGVVITEETALWLPGPCSLPMPPARLANLRDCQWFAADPAAATRVLVESRQPRLRYCGQPDLWPAGESLGFTRRRGVPTLTPRRGALFMIRCRATVSRHRRRSVREVTRWRWTPVRQPRRGAGGARQWGRRDRGSPSPLSRRERSVVPPGRSAQLWSRKARPAEAGGDGTATAAVPACAANGRALAANSGRRRVIDR